MNKVFSKLSNQISSRIRGAKTFIDKRSRKKYIDQHQLTSTTKSNRYPTIFSSVKSLTHMPNLKILSYGCSTGEECFSLREYFPKAKIIGADINTKNLNKALKQNNDENIYFILSEEETLRNNGPYNIIFAMSVLCRWEDTKDLENCELIYPFFKFEKTIENLYSLLEPGGLLIVYNANFKVEDCSVAKNLISYNIDKIKDSGFVHKFDKQSNRLIEEHSSVIYRKILNEHSN